jgi:hypothetical protein
VCGEFALRRGEELVSALPGVAAQGPAHLLNVASAHFVSLPAILRVASPFCAAQEPGRARLTPVSSPAWPCATWLTACEMAPASWLTIPPGLPTSMTFGALGMAAGLRAGQAAAGARKLLPA